MSAIRTIPTLIEQLPAALQRSASLRHLTESQGHKTAGLRAIDGLQQELRAPGAVRHFVRSFLF